MAKLEINIPDEHVQRILDAFCTQFNYEELGGELTKVQFTKRHVIGFIKATVLRVEGEQAARQARQDKADDIGNIGID